MLSFENTKIAFQRKSNKDLIKSYWLFKMIGNNQIVKLGPILLKIALSLKLPILGLIKKTIYNQFCGGESIEKCQETIDSLWKYKIGTILDYSVEGKNDEKDYTNVYNETIQTIKKAKANLKIPFTVFKISGLASTLLLEKISSKSELSQGELKQYHLVKERLQTICSLAKELDVKVFIDAEESWIQNAIDDFANDLMKTFNTEKALIYNTLQMYRWDRLDYLYKCHKHAENNNYFLALKLVRGAYMEKEREKANNLNYPSPIQTDKINTDRDYDKALEYCLQNINTIAICAGTHNEKSSKKLAEIMKKYNIDNHHSHVYFSQLLGMSDHISFNLSSEGYNVAKYVPYGPVKEVIPYLIRRAQENTSISGQTSRELKLIIEEKARRKS